MKRFLLSAALLVAATTAIQAHTLDGIVKDNKTGEPLIGTVIRVKELPINSIKLQLEPAHLLDRKQSMNGMAKKRPTNDWLAT